jgi:Prealbumin-like fold domain
VPVTLPVPSDPNQTERVTLPGDLGEVVLNEHVRNPDGSLTVNAIRVRVGSDTFTTASATCEAGTRDGAITGRSVDREGRLVGGVVYQLEGEPGEPTCTTNSTGRCTFPSLDPGTYRLCVIDVPDGYRLPEPRCKGPFRINGNRVTVSFVIPPERGKKG